MTKQSIPPQAAVEHHNDSIGEDYRFWSPSYNIHFGYLDWGTNPLNREAMLLRMNEAVFQRLQPPSDSQCLVVDAGCGAGAVSRYMAGRLPFAHFVGVSLRSWLLELGKKMNEEAGLSGRIKMINGDFQSMSLPDGIADAVFCIESACYGEGVDKAKLIKELHRILKPGGRLVVVDAFRKNNKPLKGIFAKIFNTNARLWAVRELAVLPLFEKRLAEEGFVNVETDNIGWRAAASAMHIPFVVLRLWWNGSVRRNDYWKALLMTLLSGLLIGHMGYYIVTARKQ